jgi:hypothetical protein
MDKRRESMEQEELRGSFPSDFWRRPPILAMNLKGSSLSFSFQHEGRPPVLGLELGIFDFPGPAASIVAFPASSAWAGPGDEPT